MNSLGPNLYTTTFYAIHLVSAMEKLETSKGPQRQFPSSSLGTVDAIFKAPFPHQQINCG